MREVLIYCPCCCWRPAAASRWSCSRELGGCGKSWNTFDTRGVCPRCHWKWEITQCPSCSQFSPHEKWYHDPRRAPERARRESVEA